MPRRIVLVSDLQQGGRLDVLGDFEWPADVELDVRSVADDGSNASLEGLAAGRRRSTRRDAGRRQGRRASASACPTIRTPSVSRSRLNWDDDAKAAPIPVYVPPGESRVVRAPRPREARAGDRCGWKGTPATSTTCSISRPTPDETATVLFLGGDAADDPNGLLYYLGPGVRGVDPSRGEGRGAAPAEPLVIDAERPPALVVVGPARRLPRPALREGEAPAEPAAAVNPAHRTSRSCRSSRRGGTVLLIPAAPWSATLAGLVGSPVNPGRVDPSAIPVIGIDDAKVRGDVMLGEIAFDHPLFAPFAGPQFNDFTKIRFWKYRKLPSDAIDGARVVARFETGDPAVIEKPMGKGRLVVFAQRLESRRRPARAVVEVRPFDVGAARRSERECGGDDERPGA